MQSEHDKLRESGVCTGAAKNGEDLRRAEIVEVGEDRVDGLGLRDTGSGPAFKDQNGQRG